MSVEVEGSAQNYRYVIYSFVMFSLGLTRRRQDEHAPDLHHAHVYIAATFISTTPYRPCLRHDAPNTGDR